MDPAAYIEMDAIEGRHWWFRGKRRLLAPLVARMLRGRGPGARVLEVGCGTGGNLAHFAPKHPLKRFFGLDFDPGATHFTKLKSDAGPVPFTAVRGDGLRLPFRPGCMDGALALDIVEHFEDDDAVMAELFRVLAPGACLVLSVPAWPSLWSPHDDFLHHKRRYRPDELRELIRRSGFELTEVRGFNFLLLPPIWLVRWLKRKRAGRGATPSSETSGSTDFFNLPRPIEACLAGLFVIEAALVRLFPIQSGVSIMAPVTPPTLS
ncbi:MAG: class I SAM-dependent methyltransferase [Planctomycetota bacterium]|nr:class I SAM-dependent methyltransferase [Planctomycetota bacterium]